MLTRPGLYMRQNHPPAGRLFVVGTPIGNLQDLSPRACQVLSDVQVIAAEDTRRTRGLLSRIGVQTPTIAYHEHNEETRAVELVERMCSGESVALVSDAGMPLISDPGWRLVREARRAGIEVFSVPGPSSVSAALSVAGLPTDRYVFEGFLPRRKAERAERLQMLAAESRTLVFFESVHRIGASLKAMGECFGADRAAGIARELTKLNEATYSGSLAELHARLGTDIPLRGEFVVLVAGRKVEHEVDEVELRRVYELLSAELAPGRAVSLSARIVGVPRNVAYRVLRIGD